LNILGFQSQRKYENIKEQKEGEVEEGNSKGRGADQKYWREEICEQFINA
jgi:hypothetical protein